MLNQLTIQNFAIVDHLDLELSSGMSAISGETGAGKSIMLDALGLALGDRAESGAVRLGSERAEITADFSIDDIPQAANWLKEQDLDQDGECILRRVITKEGRSRCYINGRPSTVAAVRALSEFLVAIHGQHEHQRLLKKEHHRTLLDDYAGHNKLAESVRNAFNQWAAMSRQLQQLSEQSDEQAARIQLLRYQTEELAQLNLQPGELKELEEEQKKLANAGEMINTGNQLLRLATEDEQVNCLQTLNHCLQLVGTLQENSSELEQVFEMFNSAMIQVEEASNEVSHFLNTVEINPVRQQEVEERLSLIYELARKHRILPEQLIEFQQSQEQELENLTLSDRSLDELEQNTQLALAEYKKLAEQLSNKRQKAALKLGKAVDKQLHNLGMPSAQMSVLLTPLQNATANGAEEIEFLIITNKGQPAKPLAKIASGGELSRISLAIQVITAQTSTTPSLVFDEVDVGIGGAIAEVVGRLLRELGEKAQILCVTHQPQVASQGHQHLFVSKRSDKKQTHTHIAQLNADQRIQEVARMLGGIDITERSLEHAREMLGNT